MPDIITARIQSKVLPNDPNAIYLFLVSSDIEEYMRDGQGEAFCVDYCGYHSSFTIGSKRYYYALSGNVQWCLSGCAGNNYYISPNGDTGIDAMFSVIAHELVEAMSDPVADIASQRAWQDANGQENADKW